jgi:hypothetical protein
MYSHLTQVLTCEERSVLMHNPISEYPSYSLHYLSKWHLLCLEECEIYRLWLEQLSKYSLLYAIPEKEWHVEQLLSFQSF